MIDLLSVSHSLLREHGFSTRVVAVGQSSALAFEDDAVLGFVYVFDSALQILDEWQDVEKTFLLSNANRFRTSSEKAWNIYSVFVCSENSDEESKRKIRWIEEDLRFTRKLTGCEIATRYDLINVILPLLGLQQKPFIQTDALRTRLERRLKSIAGKATDSLLNETIAPADVARMLRDSREN